MSNSESEQRQDATRQDIADSSPLNPQLVELREKVAKALHARVPDSVLKAKDFSELTIPLQDDYLADADAAILAVLEELSRIEVLPLPLMSTVEGFDKHLKECATAQYRAMTYALLEQFKKEVA